MSTAYAHVTQFQKESEPAHPHQGRLHAELQDLNFNAGGLLESIGCKLISDYTAGSLYLPREYFVLTDAGKPVFIRYI